MTKSMTDDFRTQWFPAHIAETGSVRERRASRKHVRKAYRIRNVSRKWNTREERDLWRIAENQVLESPKTAQAEREANRQGNKLNFLISQTKLHIHLIERKIKEPRSDSGGGRAEVTDETVKLAGKKKHVLDHAVDPLPSFADTEAEVTNFAPPSLHSHPVTDQQEAYYYAAYRAEQLEVGTRGVNLLKNRTGWRAGQLLFSLFFSGAFCFISRFCSFDSGGWEGPGAKTSKNPKKN